GHADGALKRRDDQPARPAGAGRAGAAAARPQGAPQLGGGADRPRPQDVPEGRRGAGQEGGAGHGRAERAREGAAERAAAADDARVRAPRARTAGLRLAQGCAQSVRDNHRIAASTTLSTDTTSPMIQAATSWVPMIADAATPIPITPPVATNRMKIDSTPRRLCPRRPMNGTAGASRSPALGRTGGAGRGRPHTPRRPRRAV